MSLYVLVGPDGDVYELTVGKNRNEVWQRAFWEGVRALPNVGDGPDRRKARRLGWRVRKCKIVLEEE